MDLPAPQPEPASDRRRQYRISARRGEVLVVDLLMKDGLPQRAEVLNVAYGGAALRFARPVAELALNSECRLCFRFGEMGRPILLQARVVARVQDGEVCKVRFQFQDPERLDALLHPSAWRVFNRRQSYRVAPRQSERIDVAVGWKDKKRIGVLVDVSVSGIAVRIPWSGDEPLARGEPVAVGFRLPECETPIVAVTSLRNVSEEKGFARWGLEFDVRHSKGWVPKERRIVEYLMRRQREELAETRQRDDDDEERRTA